MDIWRILRAHLAQAYNVDLIHARRKKLPHNSVHETQNAHLPGMRSRFAF